MEPQVKNITNGSEEILQLARYYGSCYQQRVLLLVFHYDWCDPPIEPITNKYSNLIVCKINVEDKRNNDITYIHNIQTIPTFYWIQSLNIVDRLEGIDLVSLDEKCQNLFKTYL